MNDNSDRNGEAAELLSMWETFSGLSFIPTGDDLESLQESSQSLTKEVAYWLQVNTEERSGDVSVRLLFSSFFFLRLSSFSFFFSFFFFFFLFVVFFFCN